MKLGTSFLLSLTTLLLSFVFGNSKDVFDRADVDHNGVIDRDEFSDWSKSVRNAIEPFLLSNTDETGAIGGGAGGGGGAGDGAANVNAPNNRIRNKLKLSEDAGFWSGFVSGIITIIATEIGDKTFFIAAIMSMKHERLIVFSGAIAALAVMTVLSVAMGGVVSSFLPKELTHYAGAFLFVFFGLKMLKDSRDMASGAPSDELNEVEEELTAKKTDAEAGAMEDGAVEDNDTKGMVRVFTQGFILTFLAEWGDRSQIATITLAAAKSPLGVTLGAIFGHSMCTGLAVVGGKILATRISEKTVTLIGGTLFLLFALHSFMFPPQA